MKINRKFMKQIILAIIAPVIAGIFLLVNSLFNTSPTSPQKIETNKNEINISGGKFENIDELKISQENYFNIEKDTPILVLNDLTDDEINAEPKEILTNNKKVEEKIKNIEIPKSDFKIEYVDKFRTRFNRTIHFLLSNPNNNGLIVVDSIELVILDSKPFRLCHFPDGPWAPIPIYKYEVEINPDKKRYLINEQEFSFKPTEINKFSVLVKSKQKNFYKTRIEVKYFNPNQPETKYLLSSEIHPIPFPEWFNLDTIFSNASKIDLFLNLYESINPLFIKNELGYSDSCHVRFILSDSIRVRSGKEMFFGGYEYKMSQNFNIIPDSIYNSAFKKDITYYKSYNQFIVVDDTLLIQYISYGNGQLFFDKEISKEYLTKFNELYSKEYMNKELQNDFLAKELYINPEYLKKTN